MSEIAIHFKLLSKEKQLKRILGECVFSGRTRKQVQIHVKESHPIQKSKTISSEILDNSRAVDNPAFFEKQKLSQSKTIEFIWCVRVYVNCVPGDTKVFPQTKK